MSSAEMADEQPPQLSVIIAIVSDTTDPRVDVGLLSGCLDALAQQVDAPTLEIIVAHLPDVEGIDALASRHPSVTFLPVPDAKRPDQTAGGREHHDVLRARALARARGELVALLEDHARPARRWCANIVAAHQESVACIGGAMGNVVDRPLNWAVYFCDYGKYQNPLPEGDSFFASDSNVSYKRVALEKVRKEWADAFREVIVNGAIRAMGERIVLRRDIFVNQCRSGLRLGPALRERFIWGRSYAATRNPSLGVPRRVVLAALSPILPGVLTYRLARTTLSRRRYVSSFITALPLILILLMGWSLGEGVGYIAGLRRS